MRRTLISTCFLLALPLGCSETPKPEKATGLEKIQPADAAKKDGSLPPLPTGPVAVVNGAEVPAAAFRAIYDLKVQKYAERGREIPPSADRRYRKSIAERLVYQEVLRQEAKKLGVAYDDAALQDRLEQQKKGIRDWDKHLKRRGETEDSLKEMYIAELLERAILDKQGKLAVTDEEIAAEYEKVKDNFKADKPRVRASHILIPVASPEPEKPLAPGEKRPEPTEAEKKQWEAEAKKKADEVYKAVTAPDANFDELAKQYSTGPSANKGGDLGIFTEDKMVAEFSAVAFKLKPGQISKPVKTKFGYHVIRVQGKWGPGELPLDALRDQIRERLEQRKIHQGRRELKDQLLAQATIKNHVVEALGPDPKPQRGPAKERVAKDAKKPDAVKPTPETKPAE